MCFMQMIMEEVKIMTFDEALNELEPRTIWSSEMRDLLEQLREEYAPTVEMTKEQANHIKSLTTDVGNVFNEEELPADGSIKMTDKMIELDDSYIPLKYLNTVLHPETIKEADK